MDADDHVVQAQYLLGIVNQPLIIANGQHRSEILWGAATQMVKAVAKTHGLPNRSHRALIGAVRWTGNNLAQDPDLIVDFNHIEELHKNFYDGDMYDAEIEEGSVITARFVNKMQIILDDI